MTKSTLLDWIIERWAAEVKHRPLVNKSRRPLDDCWRQIYRKVSMGKEIPFLTHDELIAKREDFTILKRL